jgi:hypothetical protein
MQEEGEKASAVVGLNGVEARRRDAGDLVRADCAESRDLALARDGDRARIVEAEAQRDGVEGGATSSRAGAKAWRRRRYSR